MPNPTVTIPPARSYLTVAEYKNAPTGVDTGNLVPGGTQAQNDAELANVIARASSWMDQICRQILAPTTDTERHRVRPGRLGQLYVKTDCFPIIRVTALKYTADPRGGWTSFDLAAGTIVVGDTFFEAFVDAASSWSYWVEFTYENGYPNTTLASSASAGATSIVVASSLGIYPGQELTIYDAERTETVSVSPSYVSGSTIQITGTLANSHSSGVAVSALPPAVKEAALLATSLLIRNRGAEALVLDEATGTRVAGPELPLMNRGDYSALVNMLAPFTVRQLSP